ncbi:tetratricopeptide repeat protein [Desulfotalea psychrophila]|uniref:Uncharacterized protein n=1 Tax=Desulfotalea psychrophila (strain LSv54 / DSM 12343) TaxID=177439 RepID=Q6AJE1_DESPS|nr:tetratricopeptide repeat protein [Desulfotalea psychrophila]CAG37539.1 hypothetical protein DP2810 [Desulfotalea psychrophila LSv54]
MGKRSLLIICALPLLISCSAITTERSTTPASIQEENGQICAYSSFLKAHTEELNSNYENALQYYQEALICDPGSIYIQNKLPLMMIKMGAFEEARIWIENNMTTQQDKIFLSLLLARLYSETGNPERATDIYNHLLKEKETTNILLRLALLYHNLGQYRQAEAVYYRILHTNNDSYLAHLYLAQNLFADNQLQKAATHYEKALKLEWSIPLAYEVGNFYTELSDYEQSLALYNKILLTDQSEELAFSLKLLSLLQIKKTEQALKELNNRRSYSENPEYLDLLVSQTLLAKGQTVQAEKLLEEMIPRYSSGKAALTLSILAYEKQQYNKALQWLRYIKNNDTSYEQSIHLRLQILFQINQFSQAIKIINAQIKAENTPYWYKLLAATYSQSKNEKMAEQTYRHGLKEFPVDPDISYAYALFLDKKERFSEAVDLMLEVLKKNSANVQALNFIGYTWANNEINLPQAKIYLQKAARLLPENGFIHDSLGWCYYKLGEWDMALTELQKAHKIEPQDPFIAEHLGDTYLRLQDYENAIIIYRSALKLYKERDIRQKEIFLKEKIGHILSQAQENRP